MSWRQGLQFINKHQNDSSSVMVSVLLPTYNRLGTFRQALASALGQMHGNIQVIVVNDGGQDVSGIVDSFNDDRIVFINRRQNRGKAYSLNEALQEAKGEYIAYLDDDDIWYPNHVVKLVDALERNCDCGLAYSDLYRVKCRVNEEGSREVLSKIVDISRDFDRFFMLFYNHVLHVSMIHRKELLGRTGGYNENLDILIDWDMTRKMCFFTDFYHVTDVTGEFYSPVGECDRISIQHRKDHKKYLKNLLEIRNTRPIKPWDKIKDMSIVYAPEVFGKEAGATIGSVWRHTFYPYQLYLPLCGDDMGRLDTSMPNLVKVGVGRSMSVNERIDAAAELCEGEYVVIIQTGFPITDMWVERSLYALSRLGDKNSAYLLENSNESVWGIIAYKDTFMNARRMFGNLPIKESLVLAGVKIREVTEEELPFKFDNLLQQAQNNEANGDWAGAAKIYEYMAGNFGNSLWMRSMAANAYYKGGHKVKAKAICEDINSVRPTVDTLLLQAKAVRRLDDFKTAIELLRDAEAILEGNQLQWT